jgi:hypothetical protein
MIRESILKKTIEENEDIFKDEYYLHLVFILMERKKENSFYKPMLELLEERIESTDDLVLWSEEELD